MHLPDRSARPDHQAPRDTWSDAAARLWLLGALLALGTTTLGACTSGGPAQQPAWSSEAGPGDISTDHASGPQLHGTNASQGPRGAAGATPAAISAALTTPSALIVLNEAHMGLSPVKKGRRGRVEATWQARRRDELALAWRTLLKESGIPQEAALRRYTTLPVMLIDAAWAPSLAGHPGVAAVHDNTPLTLNAGSSLRAMGLTVDGQGFNSDSGAGQGTTVAIIDAAVAYWESDFGDCGDEGNPQIDNAGCAISRLTNLADCDFLDQVDPDYICQPNGDDFDLNANSFTHGSNVAAIARRGAPGASIWSLNITHVARNRNNPADVTERILSSDVVAALDAVNAQPEGVVAVNLSLGSPRNEGSLAYCNSPLSAALRTLWREQGIVALVAAGNEGNKATLGTPACDPYAISVGAHYDSQGDGGTITGGVCSETIVDGRVTCFSNSQTALDLVAPGAFVNAGGDNLSGTSQATPHASAAVAIIQSDAIAAGRRLDPEEVHARLRLAGDNLDETATGNDDQTYNYTHRRLILGNGPSPQALYALKGDPRGSTLTAGAEVTLTIDTQNFDATQGSQAGRRVTDVWLDLEIGAADAADVQATLTAPSGQQRAMALPAGVNVHALLGAQADTGLRDAFDLDPAEGTWSLTIRNNATNRSIALYRAILMMSTEEDPDVSPDLNPSFANFNAAKDTVTADGADIQTLSLTLNEAADVNEVRLIINYTGQAENGRDPSGYFQFIDGAFRELGTGLGNADVELLSEQCTRTLNQDGSVTFDFAFTVASSFGAADNNSVSGIWYQGGALQTSWRLLNEPGQGFDVLEGDGPAGPPTFSSFALGTQNVLANSTDTQTLSLTLDDAADVNEVRLIINYPGQAENGRDPSGYFQFIDGAFRELGTGFGNADVELLSDQSARTLNQDGSVTFAFVFTVASSFGAADNNSVSGVWYQDGALLTSWRRLTEPGLGFDVLEGDGPVGPPTFSSFALGAQSVQANGADVQTLSLTLDDAADVNEVRLIINYPGQAENGRDPSGYFQFIDGAFRELGTGFGNADVELLSDQSARTLNQDGSVTFDFAFTVASSFGAADNNSVSGVWYQGGALQTSWRLLNEPGQGFDVLEGDGPAGPPAFSSFALGTPNVLANGADTQTLSLTLSDAVDVNEVRLIINYTGQAENGRDPSGYFQFIDGTFRELGAGLGNADVELLTDQCSRTLTPDGSVTFNFVFTVAPSFGAADNNSVSGIWYQGGALLTSWRRLTEPGQGFNVTQP